MNNWNAVTDAVRMMVDPRLFGERLAKVSFRGRPSPPGFSLDFCSDAFIFCHNLKPDRSLSLLIAGRPCSEARYGLHSRSYPPDSIDGFRLARSLSCLVAACAKPGTSPNNSPKRKGLPLHPYQMKYGIMCNNFLKKRHALPACHLGFCPCWPLIAAVRHCPQAYPIDRLMDAVAEYQESSKQKVIF